MGKRYLGGDRGQREVEIKRLSQYDLTSLIMNLEAQNKELRKYARHENRCYYSNVHDIPCSCGLDKLLTK